MRPAFRRALGAAVAVTIVAGLVALSRASYGTGVAGRALLRLSWSGRPDRIEHCRELSDSELARLPAHMRQRVECKGRSAKYFVRVLDSDVALSTDTVAGGGLRGDRSIHMLREYPLDPGSHAIRVQVVRTDSTREDQEQREEEATPEEDDALRLDRAARERQERRRQREERLPRMLQYDTTAVLRAGEVVLVTYDPIQRRLVGVAGER